MNQILRRAAAPLLLAFLASGAAAQTDLPPELEGAQVVFLGGMADNPAHQARQAELIAALRPTALVFAALDTEAAAGIHPEDLTSAEALAAQLGWEASEAALFFPSFAAGASLEAAIFGAAMPPDDRMAEAGGDLARIFGPSAGFYSLDEDLAPPIQALREEQEATSACASLTPEGLAGRVAAARLREARLAETALEALAMHGAPVAVIAGNALVRPDWAAPALIAMAAPEVPSAALGQAEEGGAAPEGGFDLIETTVATGRDDPCAAPAGGSAD